MSYNVGVYLLRKLEGTVTVHRHLKEKDVYKGKLLFQNDIFMSSSYFEFDETNEIIITFCSHKKFNFITY